MNALDLAAPEEIQVLERAAQRAEDLCFAVCIVDRNGMVVVWSPGAEQTFGWSARQAVGSAPPMIPAQAEPSLGAILAAAAQGRSVRDLRTVWRRRNGSPIEVVATAAPLLGAEGTLEWVGLAATDPSADAADAGQLDAFARDVRETFMREQQRAQALEASYLATVRALATAVEAKDGYTGGHIRRVHDIGLLVARAICPEDPADPQMAYGFLLHDVGKLAVPDAILTKPGRLTADEFEQIKLHPEQGVRILADIPFLDRALDVVRHHHERWDGGGYPAGLAGREIPLWARIFSVVDTLDAMTSDRPYRAACSLDVALEELRGQAGSQFDPACVGALADVDQHELEALLERGHDPSAG
jgi:ribonuclease P protein subunit RPR2